MLSLPSKPKKIIAWKPTGNINIPSSRLRAFIPCQYLKEAGWNCEIFDKKNLGKYNAVIFQKSYEAEDLEIAGSLKSRGTKIIFDLCDNHFYAPPGDQVLLKRKERLLKMIGIADEIIVSTPELTKLIIGKKSTVIDDALYLPKINPAIDWLFQTWNRFKNPSGYFNICWFGSAGHSDPRFGMIDLQDLLAPLENIHLKIPIRLNVISNSPELFNKYINKTTFPSEYHPWKKSTFPYLLRTNDICVIPINKNPFTICKTNNRPILSLMYGIPVIADRIPSYEGLSDFILFGDWEKNILKYAEDKELRTTHVRDAQAAIRKKYNKESVTLQWNNFLTGVLS
jgi:hypothetical protein